MSSGVARSRVATGPVGAQKEQGNLQRPEHVLLMNRFGGGMLPTMAC